MMIAVVPHLDSLLLIKCNPCIGARQIPAASKLIIGPLRGRVPNTVEDLQQIEGMFA